jgi:hypothetical protein
VIDRTFGIEAKEGTIGRPPGPGASEVILTVDTGIAGTFVFRPAAR